MLKKTAAGRFSFLDFLFSFSIILLIARPVFSANDVKITPLAASGVSASKNTDEQELFKDRDSAMAAALESAKKTGKPSSSNSSSFWNKLAFWKKSSSGSLSKQSPKSKVSDKKESRKTTNAKAQDNWKEVMEKRKERLDQFPSLDPEQVQESLNQMKVELKHGFIGAGDHNLDEVIKRAIQVHMPAQIAYERVQLSERRIFKTFRDFFSSADFTRSQKDGTLSSGPYKSRSWRLSLRQPLFHGGVLWNTYQMEMANRDAAKKELEKTVSDLVQTASAAYFEYERAFQVVNDRDEFYKDIEAQKKISDEKVKSNLVSEIEKLNMDSLSSQADYNLQTANQELELAGLELQRVLELDLNDPLQLKPLYTLTGFDIEKVGIVPHRTGSDNSAGAKDSKATPTLTVEGKDLEHYIDLAYLHRSDLQVETSKLRAARLGHKISAGKLLPEADFIMEFGQLGEAFVTNGGVNDLNNLGTDKPTWKNEWKIGAEMSWNLAGNTAKYTFDHDQRAPSISQFLGQQGPISTSHTFNVSLLDGLNSLADLKETKIAVLEQVVQLEKTERDVIRQVKEAYFNYNKALIQLESNYKRMQYREKLANLAKHRLDNNEIQISEYVQAQLDYAEERLQVHKALSEFYLSKANLNRAIGISNYLKIEPLRFESR